MHFKIIKKDIKTRARVGEITLNGRKFETPIFMPVATSAAIKGLHGKDLVESSDPQIILADEPTGSLDFDTAKEIFSILKKQINANRIIIFATHNRFFANKSDCLLEMVNGSIKTINGWV